MVSLGVGSPLVWVPDALADVLDVPEDVSLGVLRADLVAEMGAEPPERKGRLCLVITLDRHPAHDDEAALFEQLVPDLPELGRQARQGEVAATNVQDVPRFRPERPDGGVDLVDLLGTEAVDPALA